MVQDTSALSSFSSVFLGESDRVSYSVTKFTSISCPELNSLVGEADYGGEAGGRPPVPNCSDLTKTYLQISNNWHPGGHMAVKILELIGSSEKSWEDAVQEALRDAAKTVRNIVGVDVLGFKADVKNGKIARYKAHVKIAFTVER